MEFLRFGSSIPGGYWGCCAVCIIQNFKVDPDAKASIQLVSGDSGGALTIPGGKKNSGKPAYFGPTYRDIFKNRIRTGTFGVNDMPNHTFLAVLTEQQISGGVGLKWLEILKEEGFEFIRTVDNSVYTGSTPLKSARAPHKNHIFGLFRNIGEQRVKDPFTPPAAWTKLAGGMPGAVGVAQDDLASLAEQQTAFQLERWNAGKTEFITPEELIEAGAPVMKAGTRGPAPKNIADEFKTKEKKASPFPPAAAVAPTPIA